MDDAVGAVMSRLREEKLDDNSIVFFISDNGGATERNTSRNDPLNGKKSQLLEGGIRVPFMIRWPGHIPAGTVYPRAVSAMDILPTALAAAGAGYSRSGATKGLPLDGINLLPFLSRDNAKTPHDALCWRYGRQAAIRKGNWKLVRMRRKAWRLYNLASDIGESTDLADERPELVAELSGEWDRWNAQLIAPRWDRR
jgi:arylsulfatase A-like enzyme